MDPLVAGLFKAFRDANGLNQMDSSDAFEIYAANTLLPDSVLVQLEMSDLLLDEATLGIDVATLEVNSQVATSPEDVRRICEASGDVTVVLHLLQAKTSASVDSAQLLSFGEAALQVLKNEVAGAHPKLKTIAAALYAVFNDYATRLKSRPDLTLTYATTASNNAVVDTTVAQRGQSIVERINDLGFMGDVSLNIVGAQALSDASRRKARSNEVTLTLEKSFNIPGMPNVDQALLGVVSIRELLKMVRDDGDLNDNIFYDNVRGFKGEDNPVNKEITKTLRSSERDWLPVLNNGVTVVARSYTPRPGDAVTLSGYQIVNGCQTSHCIHYAADELGEAVDSVFLPIRIVVTEDSDVATKIIRATNSQTAVNSSDLVALTKFQRELEVFYSLDSMGVKLVYERRSGQYYFSDVQATRIVTITEQMRAVAASFLDQPHVAARYPKHLFDAAGRDIFDDQHKHAPYCAAAYAAYRLETAFRTRSLDAMYKPLRYHILMAHKYLTLGGPAARLNSKDIIAQSQALVDSLKQPGYVATLKATADKVLTIAGGSVPTADRLKGQPFTNNLKQGLI